MRSSVNYVIKLISCLMIILLLHYKSQLGQNFSCNCQPTYPLIYNQANTEQFNDLKTSFIDETKEKSESSENLKTKAIPKIFKKYDKTQDNSIMEPKIQLTIDKLNSNHFFVAFLMNGTVQPAPSSNETDHQITNNNRGTLFDNTIKHPELHNVSVDLASAPSRRLNRNLLIISVNLNITDENSTTTRNFTKSIILPDETELLTSNHSSHSTAVDVSIEGTIPISFKVLNNKTKPTSSFNDNRTMNKIDNDEEVQRSVSSFYITPIFFSRIRYGDIVTSLTTPTSLLPVKKDKPSNIRGLILLKTYFITFVVIVTILLLLGSMSMFGKYYVESRRKLSYSCWLIREKNKKILEPTTCL